MKRPGIYKKIASWLLLVCLLYVGVNALFLPHEKIKSLTYSKVFFDRNHVLLGAKLSKDDKWRFKVSLNSISPKLIESLLEFEDKRFYQHFGIDWQAVGRAFIQNISSGEIVSGASTISMQTARLIWKTHKHGLLSGKIYQVFRTIQLELFYSKKEILELYFNLAPYGKNIEGVGAASWFYFSKSPDKLNWTEAIAMAIAPKSPNRYRLDRFPAKARLLCEKTTLALIEKDKIDTVDRLFISCNEVPGKYRALPFKARHLIDRLFTDTRPLGVLIDQPLIGKNPDYNNIRTTIDVKIQENIKETVSQALSKITSVKVPHAAVIVLDNKSREVLAYLGSPDFFGDTGQVDGVRALRSPGSILKPFLYSLALESGDYNSHSFLPNVPISYRGYRPRNYNRTDLGIVNFTQALQHSLNLPAVELNVRLGKKNDLYHFLQTTGISSLLSTREQYGQNIVLGGAEMRLDEMAALYSMMANQGVLSPIHFTTENRVEVNERKILNPESVYIVSRILRDTPIPRYKTHSSVFKNFPDVVWKTGTSSRQRDAWTIGYSPDHTVGVWMGDFRGTSIESMSGRQIAAPLFFDIMRYLGKDGVSTWHSTPQKVVSFPVCDVSGEIAHKHCRGTVDSLRISGVSKPVFCSMHHELIIEKKTGERLSKACIQKLGLSELDIIRKKGVLWPRETAGWLASNQSIIMFPKYKSGCEPLNIFDGFPPRLLTPIDGEHYIIDAGKSFDPTQVNFGKMIFSATSNNEVHELNWFLNGKKLRSTKIGESFLWNPEPGRHKLTVVDEYGRKTKALFQVFEQ